VYALCAECVLVGGVVVRRETEVGDTPKYFWHKGAKWVIVE
jgi:hypothetical protein